MKLSVTVSVVSHGQTHMVENLLRDLAMISNCRLGGVDYVVVTHNIPQPSWSCPAALADCCRIIENPLPKGFGANHNAAFLECDTDWFAVVNPDIRLSGDVLTRLIARATPDDAILAPALIDPLAGRPTPNRGLLTPWEILRRRMPGWLPPYDPAWLPGAFLLIRSETFRRVGGFDERFYLYAEDVDLCARVRLAGGRLHYMPDVQVSHAAQRSSHIHWRYLRWHVQSLLRLWCSQSFWRYRSLLRKEASAARTPSNHRPR